MAHGWNEFYHNSQPLSSDAGTLSGTSEMDRTLSQHVESLIGHQEFSNPVGSHEAPLQNSDYQTSYCPNSTIENSSSDCVYQRYCSQTQWQSDEEKLDKDYLQRCTSGDIPDFTTDGLQTPDLEGFKQDCGMLPTPFLENYSDVSSSSDTGETRPSCEYDASDVLAGPKVDVLAGHSTSDWFSPDAESMDFTSVDPSISVSDVIFPSNMKAKETDVLCIQDIMESPEKIVEAYGGQTSTTPFMTSAKNNTRHVQNDFCVTHKDLMKDFTQDQCKDISMEDHINGDVIDKIGAHTDDDQRNITSTAGTITLTEGHQNVVQKGSNHGNHDSEQINYTESKVGVVLDDKQAGKDRSGSPTTPSGPHDSTRDVGECDGTNVGSIPEVESNLEVPQHSSDQTSQDSASNGPTQVADSLVSDANDASCSEFCLESKQCSTDINLYQQKETKRLAEMPNASISPDSEKTCAGSSEENTDSAPKRLSSSEESNTESHNKCDDASTQTSKELSVKAEMITTTLLDDTNCTLNVSSSVKTVEIKKTDCRRSSSTNETHLDSSQGMETNSLEQIMKAANHCQDPRGSDAQSTDFSVNTSDEKDIKKSLLPELCSEPDFTDGEKSPCEGMETPTALKSTSTTCLECPNDERVAVTSDNNQNVFSNSESCLHPNSSSTALNSCSEMEWNSSHTDQQSTHKSRVTDEPLILHKDFAENARESSEEMDLSTVDPSVPSTLYGEPLSGEDSSCESGNAKLSLNQSVEGRFPSNRQEPQLKTSTQLRKLLHPIVKLSRLEATNAAIDSFQCKKCSHTTSTVDLLIEHHHQSHKIETFDFCESCNLYQINGEQNEKHLCGVITGKPDISSSHKRKKNFRRSRCVKCGIDFFKFYHYVSHMRKHSGKTPYRCDKCGCYFSQNCSLTKHKKVPGRCKPSKVLVTCSDVDVDENQAPPVSQKDATQNNQYANMRKCYVKLVDIAKTNLCGICGKSFCSVAKARKHRRAIHKIRSVKVLLKQCSQNLGKDTKKKHKCPLCPTLFKYSYNRARHLRNCVKETIWGGKFKAKGKYCCPLCQTTFTLARNRSRHIYNICLPDWINRLAKETENSKQVVQEHKPNDSDEEIQIKANAKTKHEERKRRVTTRTTNRSEPRFKCNLCPAVYYHYSGKFRHMKKHELFKLSGKKVKFRNSIFSYRHKSKSSSGKKTSHDAEKLAKPREDNLKLTETKEECFETATKQGNLELQEASGDQAFNCFACRKSFDSSNSLEKHRCKNAGDRPYRCLECGRGFKRYAHLIVHKNVHQRRIQCSVCKKILPTVGELIQHRNVHKKKKGMLKCPDCSLEFQYPAHLLKHLRTHEKKVNKKPELDETKPQQSLGSIECPRELKQLQCSLCQEKFDDPQVLRKHCLTHISRSKSSNRCPFCKRNYGNRNYLLRHMIKHTGDKAFSCSHCGKQFYRRIFLEIHFEKCHSRTGGPANVQVNKKQHACSYCPRLFWRNTRFKRHLHGHRKNSLHPCKKCGQYFGFNKIKQHQNDCTETAKPEAGLPLSPDGSLKTKMLQTTRMPFPRETQVLLPFKCSHCTQSFRFNSVYLRHLVSHTRVQPYKCIHCGHRFATQSLCFQHEAFCDGMNKEGSSQPRSEDEEVQPNSPIVKDAARTPKADGEAQFKCKFCTKTFVKSRSLRRHILTHNEVKPYCCKACDSCFSRYDHLKVHQTRCKGRKRRLEVCIPKVSLDDVGKGWQLRFGAEPGKENDTFSCKVCTKSFSNQSKLSRHTTLFHTPKLFNCTRCGVAFSHEKTLKKHRKEKRCRKIKQSAVSAPETNSQVGNVTGQLDGMRTKILERIQPFLNKKYKYVCSYCPRGFESKTHLEVHIRLHTGERPFSCDYCGQGFIRKDYLHRHHGKCTMKLKSSKVLCEGCGKFFNSSQLKTHKKSCKSTSNSSEAAVKQTQQITTGSPPKSFPCAYCKSRFLLFSQLQDHFLTTHNQETQEPPGSTAPLQHHLSNMPKIKEEPPDDGCDGSMNDGSDSAMEEDSTPQSDISKGFFCSYCKLSFGSKAGLMSHLRTHKDEQPFSCKTCHKGFWKKTLCRNHYRKCRKNHDTTSQSDGTLKAKLDFALNDSVLVFKERSKTTGTGVLQTNFSCKENAIDEFEQDSDGNEEQRSSCKEQKEVQYQCSECDQSFTDGLMLISHLEDHGRQEQEKKRNTCARCGRVCSNQANLAQHMKMHGLSKKHSCPSAQCSKMFYSRLELREHMKCHYPSRPFCCRLCNERFLTRISLCNHYRGEHKDDILHCQLCSKTYATKKSLARHYRETHRKEQKRLVIIQAQSHEKQQEASTSGNSDEGEDSESEDSDSAPYFPCHVCGKTFKTSESLEDHQLCHLGKKPHECSECGRCFYQASQLQQHQRMHRSEFQCQICGKGCVSLFALRKHKHSHGKSHPYRCSKCDLSFKSSSLLAEHMSAHREDNFPCDICDRVFRCKSSRAEHRKSHISLSHHPAPSVPLRKRPSPFSQSSLGHSTERKYGCRICHDRFKNPEELSEHGCIKAKERPYSCKDCDKHFLHDSHLKIHIATHPPSWSESEYSCNQCKISFSSPRDFLSHLKSHADIVKEIKHESDEEVADPLPTFICPVCDHCFPSATELIYHFSTHSQGATSGERLKEKESLILPLEGAINCPDCLQTFWGVNALRQHHCPHQPQATMEADLLNPSSPAQRKVTGEEKEVNVAEDDQCLTSPAQLPSKGVLIEHQNLHDSIEKPFRCTCGKIFSQKRYLVRHLNRHRGGIGHSDSSQSHPHNWKDLNCSQCNKSFSTGQQLSLHMRLHAQRDAGDYRCDMCYKSFSQWALLRQHQESHMGEVVYECTECDKAFAFPHLLEEHQQTHAGSSQ